MLSNSKCRSAKPKAKPYKLTDSNGLYLDVRPTGARFWRYRYEVARDGQRVERVFSLGEFVTPPTVEPEEEAQVRRDGGRLTLAEAREVRDKARALVAQGICPVAHRRQQRVKVERDGAATLRVVAEEWLAAKGWEAITKQRRLGMLQRVVYPRLADIPITQITSAAVLEVLRHAVTNNGPSVAAEAKRTLAGIFGHGIATLRVVNDPVSPLRNALPVNKTQHKRPLTRAELGQLLRDLAGYERNHQTVAAFTLMWLTLCRPGELVGAKWEEIDWAEAVWRLPAQRMKMRHDHIVPLPTQAIKILRGMQGITGQHTHVFPHRDHRSHSMTEATLRQALKQLGWAGKYSPHATRATGSTMLNEMGYNPDWIERQLAHREQNSVRSSYNQAIYVKDRAVMMQAWADLLETLRTSSK